MIWRLFVCADCDLEAGAVICRMPDDAHHEAGCPVDYCPACGDYLSLVGMGDVEVSGTALIHLTMGWPTGPN